MANRTIDLINKYDFTIQKKYGQNFLMDDNILRGIVETAKITKDDVVLEIGPGMGALTSYLCESAGLVIAVEIDRMLIPILQETMAGYKNFALVNEDILKVDIDKLVCDSVKTQSQACFNKKIKVVANLPYYITTPIIMELLEKQDNIASITVMIQKEVAERMQEGPGSKSYGALSLAVQYYAKPKLAMIVSKNCFLPKPDVDSAVINLDIYDKDQRPVKADDPKKMFDIIRAAFNQRRKTLVNALSNAQNLNYTKESILKAISEIGKPETIRGEALTLEEFANLSNVIN